MSPHISSLYRKESCQTFPFPIGLYLNLPVFVSCFPPPPLISLFVLRCAVLRVSYKAFLTHTWIKSFPNHFAVHLPPELGQIFCLLLFVVVYLLCFVLWHQAFCMISYWVFQFIISVVVDFVLPPTLFSTVKFTDHCSPKWSWWYCKYDCVTNGSLVAYVQFSSHGLGIAKYTKVCS